MTNPEQGKPPQGINVDKLARKLEYIARHGVADNRQGKAIRDMTEVLDAELRAASQSTGWVSVEERLPEKVNESSCLTEMEILTLLTSELSRSKIGESHTGERFLLHPQER